MKHFTIGFGLTLILASVVSFGSQTYADEDPGGGPGGGPGAYQCTDTGECIGRTQQPGTPTSCTGFQINPCSPSPCKCKHPLGIDWKCGCE